MITETETTCIKKDYQKNRDECRQDYRLSNPTQNNSESPVYDIIDGPHCIPKSMTYCYAISGYVLRCI